MTRARAGMTGMAVRLVDDGEAHRMPELAGEILLRADDLVV